MHVPPDSSAAGNGDMTQFCQKDINEHILGELLGRIFLPDKRERHERMTVTILVAPFFLMWYL